jgi:hypothetical protein
MYAFRDALLLVASWLHIEVLPHDAGLPAVVATPLPVLYDFGRVPD